MANFLCAAVLVAAVQAAAFDGRLPNPTTAGIPDPTLPLPEITSPPSLHELLRRQDQQTILVGPDNTCGYVDGRAGAAYTCNGANITCAFMTASNYGAVACCDNESCEARLSCLDYREVYRSSKCDIGCMQDTFTVKCTDTDYPYCGTVTFFDGIIDYYCDTISYSTPQQLYTTYDGETDGRSFTRSIVSAIDDTSTTTHLDTSSASSTQTHSGGRDEDSTSASSAAISSQTSGNNQPTSKSSTNAGAIAGGVVGGVAVLGLLGVGLFFFIRRDKKSKAAAAAAAQPAVSQAPQGPPPPQNPHHSQQSYYADPSKPGGFVSTAPTLAPDRINSTSPVSQFTDGRQSYQPTAASPTSTVQANNWQQQQPPQPIVHEAGGNAIGVLDYNANHHGELHELG
ncbi:hypothetical protein GGR52DRAFT_62549 [Hypoxylon sp. FL1284]|nr:hypothetical protein GGR52DRAFT_62549 [Hypoxylon sp. FL1284]